LTLNKSTKARLTQTHIFEVVESPTRIKQFLTGYVEIWNTFAGCVVGGCLDEAKAPTMGLQCRCDIDDLPV